MAINTVDDIAASVAVAQRLGYFKVFGAAKSVGAYQSGWTASGFPGAGATPPAYNTSGYTCDRTTVGALGQANGAVQNWINRVTASGSQTGTLIIYDRLWSCSGMGFAAATYTVTTPGSLPARITDNGVGVEAWIENFVAAGAASGTLTLNYTNAATGAAKAGVVAAVVSAPVAGQMQHIPLQAGDTGVRAVTSAVTNNTWTSGSFGITLLKRLVEIPMGIIGVTTPLDWGAVLEAVPADACLGFMLQAGATTANTVSGIVRIGDK